MDRRLVRATDLRVGMTIDDERYFYLMEVGYVSVGPKYVNARSFHPRANIRPNTAYRFPHDALVRIYER